MRRGRLVLVFGVTLLVAAGAFGVWAWPQWVQIRDTSVGMADAHVSHEVTHPGWSFPARIWSSAAPLDLPRARLVAEARARGYAEACPPSAPGEICPKTGEVIPRGGRFSEGPQPAGITGWTRPLALEPIAMGDLVGPDGELREHLPLADAPKALVTAITTSEDEDFWTHQGVNVRGAVRAAWVNLSGGAAQQGASTLTMQLVRGFSQDKERTASRKVREALAALAVDGHLGKEAVLQAYLDLPYLGQMGSRSICGFQAAARYYWGKDARDLTLAEAATLAAILPAPGRWAPDTAPDEAKGRRDRLLRRMQERGWDAAEVAAALAAPIGASAHPPAAPRWPQYEQATRAWLLDNLAPEVVYGAGLDVWTAFDPVAQARGDEALPEGVDFIRRNVPRNPDKQELRAAAALLDVDTGLLVAVFDDNMATATDFSRATQARRQSGSSIKPLIYALALSRLGTDGHPALTAAHTLPNRPRTFPNTNGWRPLNVGDDYSDTSTLAMGLAWSQNIVAASLLEEAGGPKPLIAFADTLGYDTSKWPVEMGLSLGQAEVNPLEQARLVATVARGGLLATGRPVISATDADGTIVVAEPGPPTRVMPEESAAILRDLMHLVTTYGTGYTVKGVGGQPGFTGWTIGKTGTSDDEKDLWFIGATSEYAGAVWLGYETPARVGGTAGDLAAPLWGWWMKALHTDRPAGDFVGPVLEKRSICTQTGLGGNPSCRLIGAPFLPGTAPKGVCPQEHPPPPPDKKPFENLWQRKERIAAEKAAAEG